ncbi:hypothetical protein DFH28DRAFT_1124808 [Melampsora americana]|nr:hypothetical protein DFH28DRAFT_1124808 [Melampsora americana]
MALAFFTTPTLASLATFGFGGATPATESTDSNTSESKPSDSSPKNDTVSSLLPPKSEERPVSVSAGAIIKCSDCGGDVPLMELGEHVLSTQANPERGQLNSTSTSISISTGTGTSISASAGNMVATSGKSLSSTATTYELR